MHVEPFLIEPQRAHDRPRVRELLEHGGLPIDELTHYGMQIADAMGGNDPLRIQDSTATLRHTLRQVQKRKEECAGDIDKLIELDSMERQLLGAVATLTNLEINSPVTAIGALQHAVCLLGAGAAGMLPVP